MTQNYENTSGSENPDAAAWAKLDKENGPVHLDVSMLDFSNIRETTAKSKTLARLLRLNFQKLLRK